MQRISPFKTLDIFRGFAALWVVMYHSCDRWLPAQDSSYLRVPLYAFSIRGQLGVILFFVISGYCITAAGYGAIVTGKSIGRYAFERVRRIYPPYFAALILTVAAIAMTRVASAHRWIPAIHHSHDLSASPVFWIGNIFLLQSELNTPMINVVFWSLCYEIAFYAIIGLFFVAGQKIAVRRSLAAGTTFFVNAIGVSTILSLAILLILQVPVFPFDLWHLFSIGGLLFFLLECKPETVRGYDRTLRWSILTNVAAVTLLTLAYAALRQTGTADIGHPSSKVHAVTCLVFAALLFILRRFDESISTHPIARPWFWIGAFSYSLYLVHPVFIPFIDVLGRKLGFDGSRYWITLWIQVAISLVLAHWFFLLVEKRFISKRQVERIMAEHAA